MSAWPLERDRLAPATRPLLSRVKATTGPLCLPGACTLRIALEAGQMCDHLAAVIPGRDGLSRRGGRHVAGPLGACPRRGGRARRSRPALLRHPLGRASTSLRIASLLGGVAGCFRCLAARLSLSLPPLGLAPIGGLRLRLPIRPRFRTRQARRPLRWRRDRPRFEFIAHRRRALDRIRWRQWGGGLGGLERRRRLRRDRRCVHVRRRRQMGLRNCDRSALRRISDRRPPAAPAGATPERIGGGSPASRPAAGVAAASPSGGSAHHFDGDFDELGRFDRRPDRRRQQQTGDERHMGEHRHDRGCDTLGEPRGAGRGQRSRSTRGGP